MSFKGKAIYNPSGKAGEYSYWACNFYVGCSNGCQYCYCKKGILKNVMGGDTPVLKKCFRNEYHAIEVFENELLQNVGELREHGIFFSFTTDPMLPSTKGLTLSALYICLKWSVPVKILTKCTEWMHDISYWQYLSLDATFGVAFGFTLTGHDELEPGASTNKERIYTMKRLHALGFRTFASIEPIIDFQSAKDVIRATLGFCDLYKIGLMSGGKYDQVEAQGFVEWLREIPEEPKIYLKESLQKLTRYTTEELDDNFVERDYNIFL